MSGDSKLSNGLSNALICSIDQNENDSTVKSFRPLENIINERIKNAFITNKNDNIINNDAVDNDHNVDDDDHDHDIDDDDFEDEEQDDDDIQVIPSLIKVLEKQQQQPIMEISSSPNINFKKWVDAFKKDLEKCQPTTVVSDDSFNDYSFDLDCSSDIIANDNDRIVVGKNNLSIFDDKNPLPQDTSDNFSTLLNEKHQQTTRNKPPVQSTPLPDIQRRQRQIFNKVAYRLSSPELLIDTDQPIIKKPLLNESNFDDDDIEFDEIITEHHSPENVITIEQLSNNQSLIEHQTLQISCPKSSLLLSDNNGYKLLSLEQIMAQFE